MSITGSVADSNPDYFSTPSFTVSTQNMSGGAFSAGSPLYSFVIPDQGGYDLNGNLLSVTDTVMGQWNYAYDNLNRLTQASAPVSQPTGVNAYYAGVQPTWTYDPFGNRLSETQGAIPGATPTASMPTSSTTTYTATGNQIYTTTIGTGIIYDAAGDITYDGNNYYLYDAEGRLCAVNSSGALTGYIYDASGIRVAKGSLTSFSCNFSSNGYATTSSYVLGPGGEQVTEYAVSSGASTWQHTNAFASGALLATYHDTDTYFALNDWLGTKRFEISAGGLTAYYRSLAYGNGLTQSGTAPDATEHHFTGKERDAESGNDYFDARYFSSNLGRFLSPDWSAKEEPVPYAVLGDPQSLNLYAYVRNNPLTNVDPDGHACATNDGLCLGIAAGWNTSHQITGQVQIDAPTLLAGIAKAQEAAKQASAGSGLSLSSSLAMAAGPSIGGIFSTAKKWFGIGKDVKDMLDDKGQYDFWTTVYKGHLKRLQRDMSNSKYADPMHIGVDNAQIGFDEAERSYYSTKAILTASGTSGGIMLPKVGEGVLFTLQVQIDSARQSLVNANDAYNRAMGTVPIQNPN